MKSVPKQDHPFSFLPINPRPAKPRSSRITEVRGPYYTSMGKTYLADLLEAWGDSIDSLKFGGGSFVLLPPGLLREMIQLAHQHQVTVSTGGFIERVLIHGPAAVENYLRDCKELGFDVIEISSGFLTIPIDDWRSLVRKVNEFGMKAKAEVGIQFGAGGASATEALEAIGTGDVGLMIDHGKRLLDAGAYMLMIESEGITENVKTWRTDVASRVAESLGLEKVMFEAADPDVFAWYIRNFGCEVNLFVDHSQIVQLECLRSGIWGTNELWGRVQSYKP